MDANSAHSVSAPADKFDCEDNCRWVFYGLSSLGRSEGSSIASTLAPRSLSATGPPDASPPDGRLLCSISTLPLSLAMAQASCHRASMPCYQLPSSSQRKSAVGIIGVAHSSRILDGKSEPSLCFRHDPAVLPRADAWPLAQWTDFLPSQKHYPNQELSMPTLDEFCDEIRRPGAAKQEAA